MNISICDDNPIFANELAKLVANYFTERKKTIPEIKIFNSGEALLRDNDISDIVFLDIEMPGINGIEVGNEIKAKDKNTIIFVVTSYSAYLDDAMRFNVFRYLSKPIDKIRLYRNMTEAVSLYYSVSKSTVVETVDGSFVVPLSNIISIETSGRKTTIHTVEDDYLSIKPLAYWKGILDSGTFFSSHRCYIINLSYVSKFDHMTITLFNNKYTAYLSKRKYSEFKDKYMLFLESRY